MAVAVQHSPEEMVVEEDTSSDGQAVQQGQTEIVRDVDMGVVEEPAESYMVTGSFEGHLQTRGRSAGKATNPAVFMEKPDGSDNVVVISLNSTVTVVDRKDYDGNSSVSQSSWWKHTDGGYVVNACGSLHSKVWEHRHDGRRADDTIDHTNRIKLDNRSANLRDVGMSVQNSNRGTRADRQLPPADIVAMGISRLPRYVEYEPIEMKFRFSGHPYVSKLHSAGVAMRSSGTKSGDTSVPERLHHCLERYIEMYERHDEIFGEDGESGRRRRLYDGFIAITTAAHQYNPAVFPLPDVGAFDGSEFEYARSILAMLPAPDQSRLGAENRERRFVRLPDQPYIICSATVEYPPFMFDARHEAELRSVTWDMDSGRMKSNPSMMRRYPRTFQTLSEHVHLAVFVAVELEGAMVDLTKETITTFTPTRQDLRACNLLVAPLTGRGYKPPPDRTQGDQEDYATTVGRFLPRGVTLVTDRDGKEFHVRTAPIGPGTVKPRRIPVTPEHSLEIFARKVEPLLEGGWETMFSSVRWANAAAGIPDGALRDWRVGHEHFSELRGLYEAARELVD
jgi:hypothetical protein